MSEKDQSFRLYLLANAAKFEESYRNAVISFDEDAIHDYRVALKKLRTLNLFLRKSELSNSNLSHSLKGFKKIFKTGGLIRDYQVLKNITREYEIIHSVDYSAFLDFLDIQISAIKGTFIQKSIKSLSQLDTESWRNLIGADLNIDNYQIHEASLKFIKDIMNAIKDILSVENLDNNQLHQTRKLLKQIRFIYEMRMAEEWNSPEHHLHLELLKKLEAILGVWHDKVTMLDTLRFFIDQLVGSNISKKYFGLEKKLEKEIHEGLKPLKNDFAKEYDWFIELV